jgi:hypothetical protein
MIVLGLLVLSVVSGMLGLGVAFAAVPFLGLSMPDLVHQVQPLSLLLNGVTGFTATLGFARSGYVNWKKGGALAILATLFAPIGSYLAIHTAQLYIWYLYFLAVAYLAYRMFRPVKERPGKEHFTLALLLVVPIAVLSGFLGVGPGFLLLPTLMLLGFEAKHAAGMNALAITPPSFSALAPHVAMARMDFQLTVALVIAASIGSFLGARLTSLYLPGQRVKQIFGVLLVVMTLYKIWTLL